jgi:tRNA(adenine34) deaminase
MQHERYMHNAILEAKKAAKVDEVPIGAVATIDEKIIGRSHNIREVTGNPLGHAEILLLESLAKKSGDWRLEDTTIYVTCEPCIMCMGALLQARIKRIVFGCLDPKAGACGSLYDLSNDPRLNHQIEVVSGVLADECAQLLKDFFRRLRE